MLGVSRQSSAEKIHLRAQTPRSSRTKAATLGAGALLVRRHGRLKTLLLLGIIEIRLVDALRVAHHRRRVGASAAANKAQGLAGDDFDLPQSADFQIITVTRGLPTQRIAFSCDAAEVIGLTCFLVRGLLAGGSGSKLGAIGGGFFFAHACKQRSAFAAETLRVGGIRG